MTGKEKRDLPSHRQVQTLIDTIRNDNKSGSTELAEKAVKTFQLLFQNNKDTSVVLLKQSLQRTGIDLVNAQPEMAILFSLVNGLLLELEPLKELKEVRRRGETFCKQFLDRIMETPHRIGSHLLSELQNHNVILLHSYSSTVLKVLLYAKSQGLRFSVICTESRPANEGILLAKYLARNKVDVTLITDAALCSMLPTVDCALVGVDAITKEGVWNKMGTMGLLLDSWELQIPSYVISATEKILPEAYPFVYRERDPRELLAEPVDNVKPLNYYFDRTPWKYIQHVVTNEGGLSISALHERMKTLKIHSVFTSQVLREQF
jgi:translation initiation factor 2B subunit (eIF-2B alpha/beta/delta family)